jgi:hypothetical protein
MDMYFYRLAGFKNKEIWFTNFSGVTLVDWFHEHNIKYKTEYFDGFETGIVLLEDKDRVYFHLRWGCPPRTL